MKIGWYLRPKSWWRRFSRWPPGGHIGSGQNQIAINLTIRGTFPPSFVKIGWNLRPKSWWRRYSRWSPGGHIGYRIGPTSVKNDVPIKIEIIRCNSICTAAIQKVSGGRGCGQTVATLNATKKMAASRPSYIWSISNYAHWYIQRLSTSFLFIMYINYDHGSHKLWKFWFSAKFSQKWPPVGHLGSDPCQILHTDTFNDCLQVSYSLCKWIINSKGHILIFLWFLRFLTTRGPLVKKCRNQ